jgi:hypothetical protein
MKIMNELHLNKLELIYFEIFLCAADGMSILAAKSAITNKQ